MQFCGQVRLKLNTLGFSCSLPVFKTLVLTLTFVPWHSCFSCFFPCFTGYICLPFFARSSSSISRPSSRAWFCKHIIFKKVKSKLLYKCKRNTSKTLCNSLINEEISKALKSSSRRIWRTDVYTQECWNEFANRCKTVNILHNNKM